MVAGELAKLDGLTRPHIRNLQKELADLRQRLKGAADPLERIQYRAAIRKYVEALSTLRAGPYGADPNVDNVAHS